MRLRPVVAACLVFSGLLVLPAHASCGVAGVRGTDPGHAAVNAEIDRAAARRKVPPFVLKAIAWQESRWRQFDAEGRVVTSPRCAIGVLQVLSRGFDARRLASDYRYNVDAGAQVLAAKMSESSANVPRSLGADDRRVAENWYRAAYRYNGWGGAAAYYADSVFRTIASPPAEIRPWTTPVAVTSPRAVVRGYSPTSGHAYVARLDGTWVSTLGTYHHAVVRGDFLAGRARAGAGRSIEGDQVTSGSFVARNLGWETWTTSRVSLSTYPLRRASRLRHGAWLAATRPVAVAAATPTGADGRFWFRVRAARMSSSTTVSEAFVPVVDGVVSMRSYAASSWTLHPARAPVARITSAPAYVTDQTPTSTATIGLSFSDPAPGSGVAYVEVARRAPGATAWTSSHVATTSVRLPLTGAGGHEVRVRAVDRAGHLGAWTAPVTVVVPRDDTDARLAFDGTWTSVATPDAWLGTTATATAGASVSVPVNGTSYAVIGPRGPGLATLSVYLDGALVAVLDPSAEGTTQRNVLWRSALDPGDHVLRVVAGETGIASFDAIAVS